MTRTSDRSAKMGLREQRVQDTRRRILVAAKAVFGSAGFHGAALEEVATRARVVRPTIYRHFGSKLGLLDALLSDASASAEIERVFSAIAEPDAARAVRVMLGEHVRFWAAEELLFRRVIGLAGVDPEAQQAVESRDAMRRKDLMKLVTRLARQGKLRAGWSRRRATDVLWLLTSFATFDQLHRRGGQSANEVAETLIALAEATILR
jgi:AcrR family transcriptional regulator